MENGHVIALGFFDGVHLGHGALIKKAVEVSESTGLIPTVITFDSHPMSMVFGKNVPLITSAEDRAGLIRRLYGVSDVVFLRFDREMMNMPWDEFMKSVVENFNGAHLVCGHDYSFGYKGMGNTERLREFCEKRGVGCDVVPPVTLDGERVSSTLIRELIAAGKIEEANRYLGHRHVLTDIVRSGRRLGRTINAPTINMQFGKGVIIPRHGVYATMVTLEDGTVWRGVTNVGVRPTVDDSGRVTAETYMLGYSGNLYGRTVRLDFYKFMRPEMKFADIGQLKDRIHADAESIDRYFEQIKKGG